MGQERLFHKFLHFHFLNSTTLLYHLGNSRSSIMFEWKYWNSLSPVRIYYTDGEFFR